LAVAQEMEVFVLTHFLTSFFACLNHFGCTREDVETLRHHGASGNSRILQRFAEFLGDDNLAPAVGARAVCSQPLQ
jgi:hypothetical protein